MAEPWRCELHAHDIKNAPEEVAEVICRAAAPLRLLGGYGPVQLHSVALPHRHHRQQLPQVLLLPYIPCNLPKVLSETTGTLARSDLCSPL